MRLFRILCLALVGSILPSPAAENKIVECRPGPWGRIEHQAVYLEAPEWLIEQFPLPGTQPRWCFPSTSKDNVRRFITEAGVKPEVVTRWMDDPRCQVIEGFVTVFPTPAEVEALEAMTRSIIYPELGKVPLNEFFRDPIFISSPSVEEWLRGTDLPPHIVALIGKLAYLDGDALLFSDLPVLFSHAQSEEEARSWLKEITRTKAVLAHLRLGPEDDLKALSDYWSAGRRRKDMLPFIESIAKNTGGGRIDLTHLLPAQARKFLYTYPSPDMALLGQQANCHWTSLNFFNFFPQNIYLDLKLAASGVLANYSSVPEASRLGDIIFFLDAEGGAFHSCVYVADNLVYTKNGENAIAPWILTTFEDVKQVYLRKPGSKTSVFRLNETQKSTKLQQLEIPQRKLMREKTRIASGN